MSLAGGTALDEKAARSLAPSLVVLDAATVEEAVAFVRRLREDPETRPTAIAVLSHSHEAVVPVVSATGVAVAVLSLLRSAP